MLINLITILLASTISQFSLAETTDSKIGNLFKENLQTESLFLSNGSKVALPVHYYQISALVTLGTFDLERTRALMKETGLFPVPISEKKGLAIIYMVDHTSNTIGNYREFVTLVAATPDPNFAATRWKNKFHAYKKILSAFFPTNKDREARKNEDFFFYVPFINVSTEDALLAGQEIWNLPKHLADFKLNFSEEKKSATMLSASCSLEFHQGDGHSHLKLPLYMDFNLVGFWNKDFTKIVKAPMLAQGTGYVSLFNSKNGDSFSADENSACGKWISEAGFKPLAWQFVPRSGAVLFNPNTQVRSTIIGVELNEATNNLSEQFINQIAIETP